MFEKKLDEEVIHSFIGKRTLISIKTYLKRIYVFIYLFFPCMLWLFVRTLMWTLMALLAFPQARAEVHI